jgi:hypothetical protein
MSGSSFIIRFADAAVQPKLIDDDGCIVRRIVGTVGMKHLLPLFHASALDPNPRSARVNRVTDDILKSLERTPELFANKSKGILLGTGNFEALQRNRFRVSFDDPQVEGILDGGHNMLAIGLFMLRDLMEEREWKQLKSWDDLTGAWPEYEDEVKRLKNQFDILVPVELLVPGADDEEAIEAFHSALVDICSARNNNAQLPLEAAANKKGFYDEIKEQMPKELAVRVEWRPNTWEDEDEDRPVKVRDLVALAWIPLNLLNAAKGLPIDISVSAQNIYRNKGECSKQFDTLMGHRAITEKGDASRHRLIHDGVKSAFNILGGLPELYDQIYEDFPEAYNTHNKRFRANPIVKLYDPEGRAAARQAGKDVTGFTATPPVTPFLRRLVHARGGSKPCSYPDGLIMPLVYGLQGLMEVENGKVRWAVKDPCAFVRQVLPEIAGAYQLVLEMAKWDPQKIAKNPASHEFAVQQFRATLRGRSSFFGRGTFAAPRVLDFLCLTFCWVAALSSVSVISLPRDFLSSMMRSRMMPARSNSRDSAAAAQTFMSRSSGSPSLPSIIIAGWSR